MTTEQTAGTPASQETSFGAYVSDPAVGNLTMGGSDWDGTPQIAGAHLVYHALADRTNGQVMVAEVTFPSGQRPWFHTHHREDEGFYVIEGQLTVTVIDEQGERHVFVVNEGELVWAPRGYAHSYHVTSDTPARTIIVTTPGNTLPEYFPRHQNLELDPTDEQAVAAFAEESSRLYGLEFHPEIPLDA